MLLQLFFRFLFQHLLQIHADFGFGKGAGDLYGDRSSGQLAFTFQTVDQGRIDAVIEQLRHQIRRAGTLHLQQR